jgi:hypothetical protein
MFAYGRKLLLLASVEPPRFGGFSRDPVAWLARWLAWAVCIAAVVALVVA